MNKTTPILLSYAFRPFFLLNGLFAIFAVLAWVSTLHGDGLPAFTLYWHGHEMLVGFAMAAVAGFSLTAVAMWTGRPALHGAPLAWLILCWLLGRVAMMLAGWIPARLVIALDMLFPILFCLLLGRELIGGGNRRNYVLIAITAILAVLNAVYHLGANQLIPGGERLAIILLIHTILLLVTIIAGRIVPSFTANWLKLQGRKRLPVVNTRVDLAALALTLLTGLAAGFVPAHPLVAGFAFAAALAHGYRLSRWRGFSTVSNPLLFVLHAAYAWLPAGYFLTACAGLGWLVTPAAALHALTMGAIGSMVLAVTTRVALGHTGRPLQAARLIVLAYGAMMAAVVIRVLGPLAGDHYRLMVDLSAAGWVMAFAIFTWVYWPILTQPRADT